MTTVHLVCRGQLLKRTFTSGSMWLLHNGFRSTPNPLEHLILYYYAANKFTYVWSTSIELFIPTEHAGKMNRYNSDSEFGPPKNGIRKPNDTAQILYGTYTDYLARAGAYYYRTTRISKILIEQHRLLVVKISVALTSFSIEVTHACIFSTKPFELSVSPMKPSIQVTADAYYRHHTY